MVRDAKEFLVIDRTHEDIQVQSESPLFDRSWREPYVLL